MNTYSLTIREPGEDVAWLAAPVTGLYDVLRRLDSDYPFGLGMTIADAQAYAQRIADCYSAERRSVVIVIVPQQES